MISASTKVQPEFGVRRRRTLPSGAASFAVALGAALLAMAPRPAGAVEAAYSETHGRNCHVHQLGGLTETRCKGPAGYSAIFSDCGNIVTLFIGRPGEEANFGGLAWPARGKLYGGAIEWRLAGGRPYAAILRIFAADRVDGAVVDGRIVERLLIAKVTAAGACEIATIDARRAKANEEARAVADARAADYVCPNEAARPLSR